MFTCISDYGPLIILVSVVFKEIEVMCPEGSGNGTTYNSHLIKISSVEACSISITYFGKNAKTKHSVEYSDMDLTVHWFYS